jgi:hypothetical protein
MRQMPSRPNQVTPATAIIGPTVRASSPVAMKMLMPVPTRWPETLATMAGAGAWKAAMATPPTNSSKASAA